MTLDKCEKDKLKITKGGVTRPTIIVNIHRPPDQDY